MGTAAQGDEEESPPPPPSAPYVASNPPPLPPPKSLPSSGDTRVGVQRVYTFNANKVFTHDRLDLFVFV